jgi:hypothetical protein
MRLFRRREPAAPTTQDVVAVLRKTAGVPSGAMVFAVVDAGDRLFAGSTANRLDPATTLTVKPARSMREPLDAWTVVDDLRSLATPQNIGRLRKIGHGRRRHPDATELFDALADLLEQVSGEIQWPDLLAKEGTP